jgi:hypothetical protein
MGHRGSRPAPGPRHRKCDSWVVSADRRPLVFLDVDGVLLPFGDGAWGGYGGSPDDGQLSRLDLGIGRRLAALECDLVWATTWGVLANVEVAPRIGLGTLPVVTWSEPTAAQDHEDDWFGLHWKTRGITTWAVGRPFIWVDGEISERDREWVDVNYRGPHCSTESIRRAVSPSKMSTASKCGSRERELPSEPARTAADAGV